MLPGVGGTQHTGLLSGGLGRLGQEVINGFREDGTGKGEATPKEVCD